MATRTPKSLNRTLKLLGAERSLAGASCWITPATAAQTFAMWTLPQATSLLVHMFGARDALLGLWLLDARSEEERRRAVLFGAAIDASDALSCLISRYMGDLAQNAALFVGGGALFMVAWPKFGLGHFRMGEKAI